METAVDLTPKTPLDPVAYARAHARTYAGFAHMVRWFALHIAVDLIGILCFIEGSPLFGAVFIALATALLVWGALTTRAAINHRMGEPTVAAISAAGQPAFLLDTSNRRAAA